MKLLVGILICFITLGSGVSALPSIGNSSIQDIDESALVSLITKIVEPHQEQIREWFWGISGVTYNAPPKRKETRADFLDCEVCTLAMPIVKILIETNITDALIKGVITGICVLLNLAPDPSICKPTIDSYANSILYIVRHKRDMPNDDFCGVINPGCVPISDDLSSWTVSVDDEKPLVKPKPEAPTSETPLVKILHFTDIHLDLDYIEGQNANCPLPVCCRRNTPDNPDGNDPGGKFGHFRCALPEIALDAIFQNALEDHQDTRLIFLTGDYIHSGIWLYSVEENTRHLEKVVNMLKDKFSDEKYEIFPLTGNHEPDVVNMYPAESTWDEFPIQWMYDAIAEPFLDMFPPAQLNLFRKYGYYTVNTKFDPKLRIVVLNSNICYINNFWLPYDYLDTNGQLKLFSETLELAERLGEQVYILSHIHQGSGSCWPVWSNQYNRIVNRYEGIIRGSFHGHSHEQDYKLTFELGSERPISVSYVGGSAVTDGMNSGYNVYYADGARNDAKDNTWEIIRHETYILNLTASNSAEDGLPIFQKILDSKVDYGLNSLVPEEVHNFIMRMVCDDELFDRYRKVVVKGADSPRLQICNDRNCRAGILGDLFQSNSDDRSHRERLENYIKTVDCSAKPDNGSGGSSTLQASFIILIATLVLGIYFNNN